MFSCRRVRNIPYSKMATSSFLRLSAGLRKGNIIQSCMGASRNPVLNSARTISTTPNSHVQVPDYFRARRGPFTPEEKQHGHKMLASTHWKIERVLAVSMLGIMPASIYYGGPVADFALASSVLLHGFWGVDGVLTDYVEKFFPPVHIFWYILSILGLAGLLHFNYNDIGVTQAIKLVWSI